MSGVHEKADEVTGGEGEDVIEVSEEGVWRLRGGIVDGEAVGVHEDVALNVREGECAGGGVVRVVHFDVFFFERIDDGFDGYGIGGMKLGFVEMVADLTAELGVSDDREFGDAVDLSLPTELCGIARIEMNGELVGEGGRADDAGVTVETGVEVFAFVVEFAAQETGKIIQVRAELRVRKRRDPTVVIVVGALRDGVVLLKFDELFDECRFDALERDTGEVFGRDGHCARA